MASDTVILLWRNNDNDYYDHVHELVGVFSSIKLAAQEYAKWGDVATPLNPLDQRCRSGDWYETEEAVIDLSQMDARRRLENEIENRTCFRCGKKFRNEGSFPVDGQYAHWECMTIEEREKNIPF